MPRQRAPGVYFESPDPPSRAVSEVRTDIAGFVGVARRGPLHLPVRVESWTQFLTRFGEPMSEGFLAYAVKGFFANGGRTCWVVRVGEMPPTPEQRASLLLVNREGEPVFRVWARDYGWGAHQIAVRVESAPGDRFSLFVQIGEELQEVWRDLDALEKDAEGRDTLRYVRDVVNGKPVHDVEADAGPADGADAAPTGSVLIEMSELIGENPEVKNRLPVGARPPRRPTARVLWENRSGQSVVLTPAGPTREVRPRGYLGDESRATPVLTNLTADHFTGENQPPDRFWGLKALERVDEVALVAIPDLMWPGYVPPARPAPPRRRCSVLPAGKAPLGRPPPDEADGERPQLTAEEQVDQQRRGQEAILRHCATMKDRFAVLDTPAQLGPDAVIQQWVKTLRSEAGQYAALYYPWIYVPEPRPGPPVRLVPPSGHVAGMFARVDLTAGVQKPPANEMLEQVRGVEVEIDPVLRGWLNDEGVNAIRPFPGRGVRVVGARTLVPPNAPELRAWRYVHVRRLVLMIEESIDQSTQWLVFEPNRPEKWREVDRVVRSFLDGQWRRGRLDGATADDAFGVTCDETSNPPPEVEAGSSPRRTRRRASASAGARGWRSSPWWRA